MLQLGLAANPSGFRSTASKFVVWFGDAPVSKLVGW